MSGGTITQSEVADSGDLSPFPLSDLELFTLWDFCEEVSGIMRTNKHKVLFGQNDKKNHPEFFFHMSNGIRAWHLAISVSYFMLSFTDAQVTILLQTLDTHSSRRVLSFFIFAIASKPTPQT